MIRCTVNLPETSPEAAFVAELQQGSTEARRLLAALVPTETLTSESSIIRALMSVAHRILKEQALALQYERALDAGEFDDEAQAWARSAGRTAARVWSEA